MKQLLFEKSVQDPAKQRIQSVAIEEIFKDWSKHLKISFQRLNSNARFGFKINTPKEKDSFVQGVDDYFLKQTNKPFIIYGEYRRNMAKLTRTDNMIRMEFKTSKTGPWLSVHLHEKELKELSAFLINYQ